MILLYLEYNNLLNYLCSLNHFTFDEVIEGELSIKKKLTKNNTFEVYTTGKGVFVKQFTEFYQYPFNNLWREKLIRNEDRFYKLKLDAEVINTITERISIDYDRQIIITKRIDKLQYLKDIIENDSSTLDSTIDNIISIIDKIHQTKDIKKSLKRKLEFTPYFFDMILSDTVQGKDKTLASFWLQFDEIKRNLEKFIKKHWSNQETLIHNDLSLNNILKAENQIYIIDWEYLSIGDSLWDYASLIYDLEFSFLQSKNENYQKFIDKIKDLFDIHKKTILDFYIVTIQLWRLSLDLEKIQKIEEHDKLLEKCDHLIESFKCKLAEIKL